MVGRQGTEVLHLLLQARTDLIQWVMLALAAALGALLTLLIPLLLHRAGAFLSRRVGRSFREGSLRRVAARTQPVLPHATGPLQHLTDPIPLEQVFVVPPLILRQPSSANVPTAIRWWIVGGPGSGKTTLLQMLALRWSEAVRGRPQGLLALLRTLAPADRVPAAATFTAQLPFYRPPTTSLTSPWARNWRGSSTGSAGERSPCLRIRWNAGYSRAGARCWWMIWGKRIARTRRPPSWRRWRSWPLERDAPL